MSEKPKPKTPPPVADPTPPPALPDRPFRTPALEHGKRGLKSAPTHLHKSNG